MVILASQFAPLLPIPEQAQIDELIVPLLEIATVQSAEILKNSAPALAAIFARSTYLHDLARENPDLLATILGDEPEPAFARFLTRLSDDACAMSEDAHIRAHLRAAKKEAALRIGLCDLARVWSAEQATRAVSDFADRAVSAANDFLLRCAISDGKLLLSPGPDVATGSACTIIALGKHGGQELNYSSDIDFVVIFDPDNAPLADGIEPQRFYVQHTRALVDILQTRDENGYVLRTDLRLRPDPGATPVAVPIDAAMVYYESRGQNWERAAYIKARHCAGDAKLAKEFLRFLRPFIWRAHLDFAAIADVQAMKRQINATKGIGDVVMAGFDVKLGRGGIREIEFFAQTQQLIAGGRDPSLRAHQTIVALRALANAGWMESEVAEQLIEAYWFLRDVENRLQMVADAQTHHMPEGVDGRRGIAHLMGFETLEAFETTLTDYLRRTIGHYDNLFESSSPLALSSGSLNFTGDDNHPETLATLEKLGFNDPEAAAQTIRNWHFSRHIATSNRSAREHLTELTPTLLRTFGEAGNADATLARFDQFLSRLPAGVQLFALLRANQPLQVLLVDILASAPRLTDMIANRIHVVDALLNPAFFATVPTRADIETLLGQFLGEASSYEYLLDRARIIGNEQNFLISVQLLSGRIEAKIAAHLFTDLAELMMVTLLKAVCAEFEVKHGIVEGSKIALLGMGKLGSCELSASSDIDFLLLYDNDQNTAESNGGKPLETNLYFTRLTQRFIAALSAPTAHGTLYETDMRLRPSGRAGPLATHFEAFSIYQHEKAWTWEHLALTRARVIYADDDFTSKILNEIRDVLCQPRPREKILNDVAQMWELVAKERTDDDPWNIKLAHGGLFQLEFVAQTIQLLSGCEHTEIFSPRTYDLLSQGIPFNALIDQYNLPAAHRFYTELSQLINLAIPAKTQSKDWPQSFKHLLALRLGFPDEAILEAEFDTHKKNVAAAFDELMKS